MTSRRSFLGLLPLTVAATAATTGAAAAAPAHPAGHGGAASASRFLSTSWQPGALTLVADGRAAPVLVSSDDHPGVLRAVGDLRADIERVTGVEPALAHDRPPARGTNSSSSARSAAAR